LRAGNLQTLLDGLRTDMRNGENLKFEEAARLRDESNGLKPSYLAPSPMIQWPASNRWINR